MIYSKKVPSEKNQSKIRAEKSNITKSEITVTQNKNLRLPTKEGELLKKSRFGGEKSKTSNFMAKTEANNFKKISKKNKKSLNYRKNPDQHANTVSNFKLPELKNRSMKTVANFRDKSKIKNKGKISRKRNQSQNFGSTTENKLEKKKLKKKKIKKETETLKTEEINDENDGIFKDKVKLENRAEGLNFQNKIIEESLILSKNEDKSIIGESKITNKGKIKF